MSIKVYSIRQNSNEYNSEGISQESSERQSLHSFRHNENLRRIEENGKIYNEFDTLDGCFLLKYDRYDAEQKRDIRVYFVEKIYTDIDRPGEPISSRFSIRIKLLFDHYNLGCFLDAISATTNLALFDPETIPNFHWILIIVKELEYLIRNEEPGNAFGEIIDLEYRRGPFEATTFGEIQKIKDSLNGNQKYTDKTIKEGFDALNKMLDINQYGNEEEVEDVPEENTGFSKQEYEDYYRAAYEDDAQNLWNND